MSFVSLPLSRFPAPLILSLTTRYLLPRQNTSPHSHRHSLRNATQVLNCLKVLQRVLLVGFELTSEPSVSKMEVLWKRNAFEGQVHRDQTEQIPRFVIEDGKNNDNNEGESGASAAEPPPTLPSIAES